MNVIVVGAGLSGLVSGMRLQEAGHEVVVLEARSRVGGRVLTIRDGFEDGPYAFLEALVQIQPSIPLRYVDAHTLHLGPETFMQISGGNDQLPRRIADGLDVRLGQPVRAIGWSGPGVTVETETETLSGDLVVVAVPGPLTTELGWDPPLPSDKVGALVSLRYGTGAGVGIQYAETDLVRDAIGT